MAKCACGKPAVIEQRYSNRFLCEQCFLKAFEVRVARFLHKHVQISRGEHISVALSGGKDSAAILYYLKKFTERHPFKLDAIIINEGIGSFRDKAIKTAKQLCSKLEVELHTRSFEEIFGIRMDSIKAEKGGIFPCSYCGPLRRKALNTTARELGTSKLVIAHNLDDEAQVAIMNFLRGDTERSARTGHPTRATHSASPINSTRTGNSTTPVHKGFVQRIKPLRTTPERESLAYSLINHLPFYSSTCPNAKMAFRNDARRILDEMEAKYPGTKYSVLNSFDKMLPALKKQYARSTLNKCKSCGEPTSGTTCKVCEYLEMIN